jgi:phosphinothricin acetyltransferase
MAQSPVAREEVAIVDLEAAHWPDVVRIYQQGMATGNATFETEVPSWETWDADHLAKPRLVARRGGQTLGWAVLSPVSNRCVYRGVAENSIYLDTSALGQGIGRLLLDRLVTMAEDEGIWTIEAGIFPENEASLRLHERCGFRLVGVRRRMGRMDSRWRDVVFMERRSDRVGTE